VASSLKLLGLVASTISVRSRAARSTAWVPVWAAPARTSSVGAVVNRVSLGLSRQFHIRELCSTMRTMFQNRMPRYEVLSEDALTTLDRGWRRIVSQIGVQFAKPEAVELFAKAGQKVDGEVVYLDPDFVLEQMALAPRQFDMMARNPSNNVHIGGDNMVFSCVYGPPFVRQGPARRDATMDDFRRFTMLAQSYAQLDSAGGVICEPNDAPLDSRHLDMTLALQTLTDKIYMGNVVSGANARDTIEMSSILFGGREAIERVPVCISLINCNSPLRWDDRMLDAQFEYNLANQPVILTPFLLMGAMSPVSVPATLAQQMAESFAGIALAQLIRPGCPVVFGSFLSNIDMQSGSPCFGTPESAVGLLCTGQIARHYGLPFRTGGALTSSQVPDAQAGYEALMTMLPTFLAGTNFVMHSAGWLEGGLVSGYEKFIIDIELLRELLVEFTPLEVDEESLAFGAHEEVGHGGHFLGAAHTMERFRTCFYRPIVSSSANFERWNRNGAKDAAVRAGEICEKALEDYEPPPMDDAVRQELEEYVTRRRQELGD
jgi:trimethylamine---corrinoid protein Co-methyltransferase